MVFSAAPTTSIPFKRGNKHYYYQNSGMQNQAVLYVKDSVNGVAKVLLDPNSLSKDGSVALKGVYFSKNNKYMGYSVSKSGSDWTEFFILDLDREFSKPPNSTVPTTRNPCSIGVIPKPLFA